MTDNIVNLGVTTTLPLPVERVLTAEAALSLNEVIVVGWRVDGTLHMSMSHPGLDKALMLLAIAQKTVLEQVSS